MTNTDKQIVDKKELMEFLSKKIYKLTQVIKNIEKQTSTKSFMVGERSALQDVFDRIENGEFNF